MSGSESRCESAVVALLCVRPDRRHVAFAYLRPNAAYASCPWPLIEKIVFSSRAPGVNQATSWPRIVGKMSTNCFCRSSVVAFHPSQVRGAIHERCSGSFSKRDAKLSSGDSTITKLLGLPSRSRTADQTLNASSTENGDCVETTRLSVSPARAKISAYS